VCGLTHLWVPGGEIISEGLCLGIHALSCPEVARGRW
jgi:hypothetical protein